MRIHPRKNKKCKRWRISGNKFLVLFVGEIYIDGLRRVGTPF
jgi:hypothetical protein